MMGSREFRSGGDKWLGPSGDLSGDGGVSDPVGDLEVRRFSEGMFHRVLGHARKLITDSRNIEILYGMDPDGLVGATGVRFLLDMAGSDRKVRMTPVENLKYGSLPVDEDKTFVVVDVPVDRKKEDYPSLIRHFEGGRAKLVLIDHHEGTHFSVRENLAVLSTESLGEVKPGQQEGITAVGLVDELNNQHIREHGKTSGRSDPHMERRLANLISRHTDGMVDDARFTRESNRFGFKNPDDLRKLSRILTMMANGELEFLRRHPEVWGDGIPDAYQGNSLYREIPMMIYTGAIMGEELDGSSLLDVPEPVEYDRLASKLIEKASGKKGVVAVFDDFICPQAQGILASTLQERLNHDEIGFAGVFQNLGEKYRLSVRTWDEAPVKKLLDEGKMIHADRNRYVSTDTTTPITGGDVDEMMGETRDFYWARTRSGGPENRVFTGYVKPEVARVLNKI